MVQECGGVVVDLDGWEGVRATATESRLHALLRVGWR